jgi:hypothetical protein
MVVFLFLTSTVSDVLVSGYSWGFDPEHKLYRLYYATEQGFVFICKVKEDQIEFTKLSNIRFPTSCNIVLQISEASENSEWRLFVSGELCDSKVLKLNKMEEQSSEFLDTSGKSLVKSQNKNIPITIVNESQQSVEVVDVLPNLAPILDFEELQNKFIIDQNQILVSSGGKIQFDKPSSRMRVIRTGRIVNCALKSEPSYKG